jgi:hypothetical protein
LTWSLTMVKSGWQYSYGLGFWGANGHDGIWHLALINSLAKEFPQGLWKGFSMPVFAGETLKNYHTGFDLLVVLINKLTNLPINLLYFQIIPPILALLIGILVYKFVFLWKNSKSAAFWATLFIYFGGSFGWLVSLIRGQGLGGESMFWSQQAISTLINPPFALSLVICLVGLICLIKYLKFHATRYLLPTIVFFGFLIEVKVYAGILVLAGLFVASLYEFFTTSLRSSVVNKKEFLGWLNLPILKVFVGALIISLLLYFPNLKNSSGFLVFRPFWYLETMMALSDRVGWPRFYSAMTNYRAGGVWLKAILAYGVAFIIFITGNFGTRLVGFWGFVKHSKLWTSIDIIIITIIVFGTAIPMFFLQKGTPWNTIQFFYYSLFFSGILAGDTIGQVLERRSVTLLYNSVTVVLCFIFTVPTTIGTLRDVYLPSRPPAMLTNAELEALNFLKNQPDGIVLTYPYDAYKAKEAEANPPRPLYLYESTAYVSAFSGKSVYLEDEVNLDITGYPWPERRKEVEDFLTALDQSQARKFLRDNTISYIYWVKPQRAKLGEGQLRLTKIFESAQVDVYRVQ